MTQLVLMRFCLICYLNFLNDLVVVFVNLMLKFIDTWSESRFRFAFHGLIRVGEHKLL